MEIVLTVRELLDRDIWEAVCELKGINPWALKKGLLEDAERITLSEKDARDLFLIE